jgi:diguanylate cyclase
MLSNLLAGSVACAEVPPHTLFLMQDSPQVALSHSLRFIEDPEHQLTLDDLIGNKAGSNWQSVNHGDSSLNFGYTASAYWINTRLHNGSDKPLHRLLEIGYPVLDFIDLYLVHDKQKIQEWHLGDKLPFSDRPIAHPHFLIPFELPPHQTLELYLRFRTSSSMQVPLTLWEKTVFLEQNQHRTLGLGLYYGTMLIMVLYNLFVFFSVREVNYLFYVCYVACMGVFVAALHGVTYQYLWPESVWWNDQSIIVSLFGVLLFGALFTRQFLRLPRFKPRLSRLFAGFAVFATACIGVAFNFAYALVIVIVN